MKRKILVMGAGFLGKNVMNEFKDKNFEVYGTTNSEKNSKLIKIDATKKDELKIISEIKPEIIINCVAKTNVDDLEENPNLAFEINVNATKNLVEICNQNHIRLIHISTDSVFDGQKGNYLENDHTNPINVYAKSKLKAEKVVLENCDSYVIIRTNFYGIDGNQRFLFEKIYHKLKNKQEIVGFNDVIFSPLEVKNLCQMILEVAESNYTGILHLASNEFLSKYEFCCIIAKNFGFNENLIKKGSIDDVKLIAKRPKNTTLNNKKSKEIIKTKILKFKDWMRFLKESKVEI